MWLSDRRTFLLMALAVAGCGFTPAYGPGGGAAGLLEGVAPDTPNTRDEFALVRRLSERLGPAQTARYRLGYAIRTDTTGQAITPDNVTTRYSLNGVATYTLRDAGSDAVLLTGEVTSFTSWSATGSTLSTLTAEGDARTRLMRMLADQIVTRLLASAGSLPK
ncbi:LPS assembly lipoprotein LptE [Phaeovulum sp.]|uniref:LPS assembly lipoprotein LptE n=1 Tax=Phaeovulum sp. TaxID=2934796 RepID=UPI0039E6BE36